MNWDDIRILLALVRAGSLTRASQMLGIDQSTVGRRLSSLEAALGAPLFLRSKSGIIPTELGEKLVSDAMEIERRTENMLEAASPENEPVGELRVMGDHWVLQHLANTFFPSLIDEFPKLSVRLNSGAPSPSFWSAATVSLWFEDPPQMGEFAIRLVDVPFALYTHRDSRFDETGWVSLLDACTTRRPPAKFLEKYRRRGEPLHMTANDPGLLSAAIENGLGKGLLPVCLGEALPNLKRVGGAEAEVVRTLHIHAHPDTVQSLRVQTVIRKLRENAGSLFSPSRYEEESRVAACG
ncbi:LysR family transcriptional regulator [uncultured Roseibium sp.]|uniref:LysR family transcriptional regulator n=1 Tax=uncultured Roseibium sp. TaxID=1936171 RepID=UPI0026182C3E|nr:LysR family transcriptional regulator [uncultured Roseibium sp.]